MLEENGFVTQTYSIEFPSFRVDLVVIQLHVPSLLGLFVFFCLTDNS